MKRDYLKRVGAVMLSVMVFVAFSFVTAPEAYAAKSKGKKYPVVVQIDSSWSYTSYWDGDKDSDSSKTTYTYAYNKKGLNTSCTSSDGWKTVYTRNKKGYVTTEKNYDKSGKLSTMTKYKVKKNGDVSKLEYYVSGKGFKTPYETITYTYYKKGVQKTSTVKTGSDTYKTWFDKKGNLKKELNTGKYTYYDEEKDKDIEGTYTETVTFKNTLNKKGNATKTVATRVWKGSNGDKSTTTDTTTRTFKYKKGKIVKSTFKTVSKDSEGNTQYTSTGTETNTYTKKGYISKSTSEETWKYSDDEYSTNKSTTTYKYKSIKVAKKYRHLYKKSK